MVEEDKFTSDVKHICTNITQEDWCPKSDNRKLREMLNGKSTWYHVHIQTAYSYLNFKFQI